MTTFEISFIPTKRRVRGVHQPDVAYRLRADTAEQATAQARRLISVEFPSPPYRFQKTRAIGDEA